MMALNRALLTVIFGFAFWQIRTISAPMPSPSRSQSVQIINMSERLASLIKFLSMGMESLNVCNDTGASNRSIGSQEDQTLKAPWKQGFITWPETAVIVKYELV
jgi:hypothetical protein